MVYYSHQAIDDFAAILIGLANWEKHPLEYEHAMSYVEDIRKDADGISKKSYHRNCTSIILKRFGEKLRVYKRNKQTHWNIIYNWNKEYCIAYINKISNNYLISE